MYGNMKNEKRNRAEIHFYYVSVLSMRDQACTSLEDSESPFGFSVAPFSYDPFKNATLLWTFYAFIEKERVIRYLNQLKIEDPKAWDRLMLDRKCICTDIQTYLEEIEANDT